jgi:hypothetical protein
MAYNMNKTENDEYVITNNLADRLGKLSDEDYEDDGEKSTRVKTKKQLNKKSKNALIEAMLSGSKVDVKF